MAIDAAGGARTPDASNPKAVRTVARVDLRSETNGSPPPRALQSALRHVQQTVRADDRVCPFGVSQIAVAFGPEADAVTTRSLGDRLARAVTFGMASDSGDGRGPFAAKGNGRHNGDLRGTNGLHEGDLEPTTAVVTVDRLVLARRGTVASDGTGSDPSATDEKQFAHGTAQLRHRTVVRYQSGRKSGPGGRHDDQRSGSRRAGSAGSLLIIDPTPSTPGVPGLAAQAAVATSERIGFRAEGVATTGDQLFDLPFENLELDLVVLVVGSEPIGDMPRWPQSSWCLPAQLTAGYRSLGVDVLAVSAGAGAGALSGCFEQGATVLFDLDQLPAELHAWCRSRAGGPSHDASLTGVPPRFESLLRLTTSERRVLFYLTTGKSAQEIADWLVVSLTTVRSHIRSILRKLGVRSQLAAVVCANSRDLGRIQPFTPSFDRVAPPAGVPRRRTG